MPLSDRIRNLVNKYSSDQHSQQQPGALLGAPQNMPRPPETQYPGQYSYQQDWQQQPQQQIPQQQQPQQQMPQQQMPQPYQIQYPEYQQQQPYAQQYAPPVSAPPPEMATPALPPRPQGSKPVPPPKPPRSVFANQHRSSNVPAPKPDGTLPSHVPHSEHLPGWSSTDPRKLLGDRVVRNNYRIKPELLDPRLAKGPVPTNAWWQNLVVEAGDQPVVTSPYMIKCLTDAITVCAPTPLVEPKFVASVWHDDWRLAMGPGRRVTHFDALAVHIAYTGAHVPLVRGMPFVTAEFTSPAMLHLTTVHAITSVDVQNVPQGCAVVSLNDGRTWLVCCELPVGLRQDGMSAVVSDRPVTGAVRIALVNNPMTAVPVLLEARKAIPVGGSVHVDAGEHSATFTVSWQTRSGDQPLLCAFPHHQMLTNADWEDRVGQYWSTKGPMRAVRGAQWQWTEQIEPLGFAGPCKPSEHDRQHLCELVKADAQALLPIEHLPRDPYFFGKAAARAARIALIADEIGEPASRDLALQHATAWLEPWLLGRNANPLVFDTEWHGLISTDGFHDSNADFGQGRYNDHHFHYGYFVYAAAVLARLRPAWATEYRELLDLFARDYCNPRAQADGHFPAMRNFDFFDGHSWAAGLFAFADSRNQESTSEAINAYYAAYLYALATGRTQLAWYVRAILQLEARTSRIYWHVGDIGSSIYPDTYSNDKAVVGILWAGKYDFATFFSADPACIYGIQFLPYTPATALLLKRSWVADIWPKYLQKVAENAETEPWREIIELAGAVDDKQRTFQRTAHITSHDDGNSASNSYYWIATAPN